MLLLFAIAEFWRINELSMRILWNRVLTDLTTRPRPTFPKCLFHHSRFLKELSCRWMKFVVSWLTEVCSVFYAYHVYIFLETIALNGKSTNSFKALAATDSKSQSQTLSVWAWLTRSRLLQRMLSFTSN